LIHYGSNKAAIHHSGDLQSVVARMPPKPKPAGADAFATPPHPCRTPAETRRREAVTGMKARRRTVSGRNDLRAIAFVGKTMPGFLER
jgi:hypothetical protein